MSVTTLRQGTATVTLCELAYHPHQGVQEQGAWYATEEIIAAESDTQLESGAATLIHCEKEYPVTVTVMEFEELPSEDGESEERDPACMIEIEYADGLPKLAHILGLLEGYNKKQLAALGIIV